MPKRIIYVYLFACIRARIYTCMSVIMNVFGILQEYYKKECQKLMRMIMGDRFLVVLYIFWVFIVQTPYMSKIFYIYIKSPSFGREDYYIIKR